MSAASSSSAAASSSAQSIDPSGRYFFGFVGVSPPSQVRVRMLQWVEVVYKRCWKHCQVLLGLLRLAMNAAHGGIYRGVEKEIFLQVCLRHGEYRASLELISLEKREVGLGKLTPRCLRGWARGEPLCRRAGRDRRWPQWPSWWEGVQVFFLRGNA